MILYFYSIFDFAVLMIYDFIDSTQTLLLHTEALLKRISKFKKKSDYFYLRMLSCVTMTFRQMSGFIVIRNIKLPPTRYELKLIRKALFYLSQISLTDKI